jgi:hypothetical protein
MNLNTIFLPWQAKPTTKYDKFSQTVGCYLGISLMPLEKGAAVQLRVGRFSSSSSASSSSSLRELDKWELVSVFF